MSSVSADCSAFPPGRHFWTNPVANRLYPCRNDYEGALGHSVVDASDQEVIDTQMHWHASGQNGCSFAQWIAKRVDSKEWSHVVVRDVQCVFQISSDVAEVATEASCEIVSVLFPTILSLLDAERLIGEVSNTPLFFLEATPEHSTHRLYRLRSSIGEGVNAWIMAFGPFSEMPATRRAPVFELTWRTKPKGEWIYSALNQDAHVAHLADYPAALRCSAWPRLYDLTTRETARLLNGPANELTAAKTTLAVPLNVNNFLQ